MNTHFFALLALLGSVSAYNYLVFCPLYAHSHHKFLAKIADTLTDAGHNVTFLAPIIVRKYESVKYLESTKDVIYIQPDAELEALAVSADYSKFWVEDPGVFAMVPSVRRFLKMFHRIYENLKNDLTLLDELKARKYDAMIFEVLTPTAYPIGKYLGVKAMLPSLSMTHFPEMSRFIGEPASPSVLPSMVSPFGEKMSFVERLMNTLGDLFFSKLLSPPPMYSYAYPHELIDLSEEAVRAPFVFLNSNPYLDFPRPLLTKSVLIGGISVNATAMRLEKLSQEYDEVLSRKEKNVLISFGSMVFSKDMPHAFKSTIASVIASFPDVTFIWKYESEDVSFAKEVSNVYFSKWVPQTALLADPRLSAFVTHAGLGSVTEMSYMGKPSILIPIFSDQHRNAKALERHKGSIVLDKLDLADFARLRGAIDRILNVESYRINAETLSQQLQEQPVSPHDLLVKHAEFGAKFGELPALDPYSRQMSFFTFYMLDIILLLVSVSILFLLALFYVSRCILRTVFRRKLKQH